MGHGTDGGSTGRRRIDGFAAENRRAVALGGDPQQSDVVAMAAESWARMARGGSRRELVLTESSLNKTMGEAT